MEDLASSVLKYCSRLGVAHEVIGRYDGSISIETSPGGYGELIWLSGAHVIQRVPPTESKGRRHTSIVSIAITGVHQVELDVPDKEIEISTMGTSVKAGGQNSNKVASSVRAVHKPTGITVRINGRDQHRNRDKALEVLRSRVAEKLAGEVKSSFNSQRNAQIGNNRGNKDFTWSYIDGFVKNHESGTMVRNIKELERGNLDLLR